MPKRYPKVLISTIGEYNTCPPAVFQPLHVKTTPYMVVRASGCSAGVSCDLNLSRSKDVKHFLFSPFLPQRHVTSKLLGKFFLPDVVLKFCSQCVLIWHGLVSWHRACRQLASTAQLVFRLLCLKLKRILKLSLQSFPLGA